MRFYKAALSDVVVFHDEIDLAPGRFRMKTGGGAAGNNGIPFHHRRGRRGVSPRTPRRRPPGHKDLVMGRAQQFQQSGNRMGGPLADACADAADLLAAGEDREYQGKVLMLAPAPKGRSAQESRRRQRVSACQIPEFQEKP